MLRLLTFGGLSLVDDGVPVTGAASQRSRLALLALLAVAGPAGMAREKVLACLWPESEDERARHALKQAVYALRRDLGSEHAISGTATLCLDPSLITSDVREFEEALARGDDAAAVAVYAGPFLDGVFVKGSAEFDQWAGVERSRLERAHLDAIARLARGAEREGDMVAAVQWWRRAAAAEPVSGRVALSLMRALAESGDVSAAIQHARVHDAMVQAELESPADDAVLAFAEELRKGDWTPTARPSREAAQARESPPAGTPVSSPAPQEPQAAVTPAPPPQPAPPAPARRRSPLVIAGIGLVALIAVAVGGALARDQVSALIGMSAPKSNRRLVVSVLSNQTGDTTMKTAGEMAADHIVKQLLEEEFEVVDSRTAAAKDSVIAASGKVKTADERAAALASETGAAMVISGKYYRQGDSLLFDAQVIDPVRKQTLYSVGPIAGPMSDVSKIVSRLAHQITVKLAATGDTSPGSATASLIPAPSVEAFAHARRGWAMFFENPGDTTAAFEELARAVHYDSTYTTPRLMRAYMIDVKENWPALADTVAQLNPLRAHMGRVELAALALYEADLRGDLKGRLRAARELLRLSPGNAEFALLVALSASYLQQSEEALRVLKASDPDFGINSISPMYWAWYGEANHTLGQFAEEEQAGRRMAARFPSQLYGSQAITRSFAARGDTAALGAHLRAEGFLNGRTSAKGRTLALLGARELRAHGRADAAKAIFARVAAMPPGPDRSADERAKYALALYETGAYEQARAQYTAMLAASPDDLDIIGRLGAIAVRSGDSTVARSIDARLAKWEKPYAFGRPQYWRAHLAALTGRGSDAVALLHEAHQKGYRLMDLNIITLHEEPDFIPIWSDPGFHELVRPHRDPAGGP